MEKHKLAVKCKTIVLKSKLTIQLAAHIHNVHCLSRTYQMINSAMMSIIIPVTSPPRNVPTSVAAFVVGVNVGLGCVSGVQEGLHTLTMVAV